MRDEEEEVFVSSLIPHPCLWRKVRESNSQEFKAPTVFGTAWLARAQPSGVGGCIREESNLHAQKSHSFTGCCRAISASDADIKILRGAGAESPPAVLKKQMKAEGAAPNGRKTHFGAHLSRRRVNPPTLSQSKRVHAPLNLEGPPPSSLTR